MVNSKINMLKNIRLLRYILALSVFLNIIFVGYFLSKRYLLFKDKKIVNKPDLNKDLENDSMFTWTYNKIIWNNNAYQNFKMLPNDTSDIIFLGNSLTAGFPLNEMFGNIHLKNRGIGGNTSKDILRRLDEVTEGSPKKIFLEIGINDISKGVPVDSLVANVKEIAFLIKNDSPNTQLYIQSILPTGMGKEVFIPKIEKYNQMIKEVCQKEKIVYINLYPAFYKDGMLDMSLTIDGIHLNGKGYLLWKNEIYKYID